MAHPLRPAHLRRQRRQLPTRPRPVRHRPRRDHRHRARPGAALGDPVSQSDYIVASLGEELGLAGLFAIFSLYLLVTFRGLRIGFDSADDFGALLAVGLSFGVALQAFIIIGGVTRVIPLTGLTTPFLAAGGSSLIANWIIGALLMRLSSVRRLPHRLRNAS
ncbi:FtsW/RodA/SpoVE family cell cycle protein [Leifsonia sp. L25]|uniref:FtsW/RodA/SpoVE family cell cycle protein n=1 Tax=Leifsonia sp. L25 TaxID=3423957 RepID=UPI003D6943CA